MKPEGIFPPWVISGALTVFLSPACTGYIGAGEAHQGAGNHDGAGSAVPAGAAEAACDDGTIGPSPVRRLTHAEYDNTVRDLLNDTTGDIASPSSTFPSESVNEGFSNDAYRLTVSPLLAEQYMNAAESISSRANVIALAGCTPPPTPEDTCARQFVERVGKRAFRRPLTPEEVSSFLALYQSARIDADFSVGTRTVLQAMLQSPHFLYRVENAPLGRSTTGLVPLSAYEMATRLSYFFWGTMPDDALFAQADANQLVQKDQVAQQARRLLSSPRARPIVASFYSQWLQLGMLANLTKDSELYPEFTEVLRDGMAAETEAFVDYAVWDAPAPTLGTLLTAPVSIVNSAVAEIYRVPDPGAAPKPIDLDPAQRRGILTQPSFLAIHATVGQSDPIRRGKFVRVELLCQPLPPPPPNVMATPPAPKAGTTTRSRYLEHSANPACSGCHSLIDPIGIGFENFDAIGRYRTMEEQLPIDNVGDIQSSRDADGTFKGAGELVQRLAKSTEVSDCVAAHWFRFAFGRAEGPNDACSLRTLGDGFAAAGHNLRELLIAVTQTDAFLYRQASTVRDQP